MNSFSFFLRDSTFWFDFVCRVLNWNFCPNSDGSSVNGYRHSSVIWKQVSHCSTKNWLLQSIFFFFFLSPKFINAVGPYSTQNRHFLSCFFERGRGHLMVFYLFLRAPTLIRPSWDKGSSFIFENWIRGRVVYWRFPPFFWSRIDFLRVVKSSTQKKSFGSPPPHPSLDMKGGGTALLWNTLEVINISQ